MALLGSYDKRLGKLYDNFIKGLARIAIKTHFPVKDMLAINPLFRFDRFQELQVELNDIFRDYVRDEMLTLRSGITSGVALAYTHDKSVLTGFSILSDKAIRVARDNAAEAFIRSRLNSKDGLNLSQLVWNYAQQAKSEFEVAISNVISDGLRTGTSAERLGLLVRQYLNNPDMMYRRYHRTVVDAHGNKKDIVRWRRRVIDEQGKVRFVEEPLEKVGMGHYRSSRKNATRLMRTEINAAYHTANQERWANEPFVIGMMIDLSPEHPRYDECDELAGRYPKDFLFTGWHPQCLCMVNPITIQGEEKEDFYRRLAKGEDMSGWESKYQVKDVPESYKQWVEKNRDKFLRAGERGKLGYVWKNNEKYWRGQFSAEEQAKMGLSPLNPQRMKRVKTEAEKADIQRRWDERKKKNTLIMKAGKNVLNVSENLMYADALEANVQLSEAIASGNISLINEKTRALARQISSINKQLKGMEALIGNPRLLARDYSVSTLRTVYDELDGVMRKWLAKYNYSSLKAAPLEHLKNKFTFELSNPSVSYTDMNIIKKVITENIRLIDRKIEWEALIVRVNALKSFKTKSSTFKDYLTKIEEAIKSDNLTALQKSIAEAEKKQQKLLSKLVKRGGDTKSALNIEYEGGAIGKDITADIDVGTMKSKDPYRGTFTNNIAQMQGFDAPAKLVSAEEFAILENNCGEVFYRTVNPATFHGKEMSSAEFASQMYRAKSMELNGPGGRAYGDGIYVATASWDGSKFRPLTEQSKLYAYEESAGYGHGKHTTSVMTWTRTPNVIKEKTLEEKWRSLNHEQQSRFGLNRNTYGCALGYDAMYCEGFANYMVIWNRSIIAVKKI